MIVALVPCIITLDRDGPRNPAGYRGNLRSFTSFQPRSPSLRARVEISFVGGSFVSREREARSRVQMLENSKRSRGMMTAGNGFSSKLFDHRNYNPPPYETGFLYRWILPPHVARFRPTSSPTKMRVNPWNQWPRKWSSSRSRNFRNCNCLSCALRSSEGKVWRRSLFLILLFLSCYANSALFLAEI